MNSSVGILMEEDDKLPPAGGARLGGRGAARNPTCLGCLVVFCSSPPCCWRFFCHLGNEPAHLCLRCCRVLCRLRPRRRWSWCRLRSLSRPPAWRRRWWRRRHHQPDEGSDCRAGVSRCHNHEGNLRSSCSPVGYFLNAPLTRTSPRNEAI